MNFKNITLKNYRNFENFESELSPNINLFVGLNGQGKTNLLESFYLLLNGSSFRFSNIVDIIKKNSDPFYATLKSIINFNGLDFETKIYLDATKKELLLNEKKISFSLMKKKFSCVLFSPESLSYIKESPEFRRLLIDELLVAVDKNGIDTINNYKKILKNRNSLLKSKRENKISERDFTNLYESLNTLFFKSAAKLSFDRINVIKKIQPYITDSLHYINQEKLDIFVDYTSSSRSILQLSEREIEEILVKRWQELRNFELQSGSSLIGPHKHEITFVYNKNDSRIYCSQGQQRSIILAFKMGQIIYHEKVHGTFPILMLDDVFSELDVEKRLRLLSFLEKINSQIFMTTTELENINYEKINNMDIKKIYNGSVVF